MDGREAVERRLRYQILGQLHAGRIGPGDRLPSIRQVARETGADHRAVASAYRALEAAGVVEIRPGSGVYVAAGAPSGEAPPSATVGWLTDVLVGGWERRIARAELGEVIGRCASARVRCACVESNEDHMVALRAELEEALSLEVIPVPVDPDAGPGSLAPERLKGADVVVTTIFHAELVHATTAAAGKAAVVLSFDQAFSAEIDRRLRAGAVTAVIMDPRYAARGEAFFAVTGHRGRVRYVLADRVKREGVDPRAPGLLVTRAARRRLGMEEYHLLPPPFTVISPESVRALFLEVVRRALTSPP